MSVSRRRFLKVGGAGLGLGLAGGGAFLATHQPRFRTLPRDPDDASRPLEAAAHKRVVIVGGGLAGLVAAIELATRKLDVTLVERAAHLGGKLGGWKVDVGGESFPMEHGFHGFFSQYHNLYEVLRTVGAAENLAPPPAYPIVFPDRPEERFAEMTNVFPFNVLSVVRQSKTLHLADFMRDGYATYDLMRWRGEETYRKHDATDFRSFTVDGRMNKGMRECIVEPFGKTTLNRLPRLSAAEGLRFFHFFFIGNPDGLWYRYSKRDALTDVITPLQRRLEALGGRVRLGAPARRLIVDGGRVTGVELEGDGVSLGAQARVAASSIAPSGWTPIAGPDGSAVYVARRGERFVAFDARCTHMACPVRPEVRPDGALGGFACPCHGGRYAADGAPTAGPPQKPLRALPVIAHGDELLVGEAGAVAAVGEIVPCDYAISACGGRGTRALMKASDLRAPELSRKVAALGEADPYLVYRVWLDGKVRPDRTAFYTCAGYRYVDSLAVYGMLQEPYISWCKRTGKSVIELHSYAVAPEDMRPSEELARLMLADMRKILPELADAKVLHGEYQEQSNFSRFAPGDHANRPSTETELPNLFLAGDHVRMEAAVALMEAATMSGRLAANAVLRREKVREVPVYAVAEKGPLA